jgi:phage terminase small subunit
MVRRAPKRILPPPPKLPAKIDWGKYGHAMRALSEQHRRFALALASDPATLTGQTYGAYTRAARAAGYKESSAATLGKMAHQLAHFGPIKLAVDELARTRIELAAPLVAEKYIALLQNEDARDHGRAVMDGVQRLVPSTTTQKIDITHRLINPDQEALEELGALRQLGTSREKLLELFGGNGLVRLERLEAAELARRADAAKVIEVEANV